MNTYCFLTFAVLNTRYLKLEKITWAQQLRALKLKNDNSMTAAYQAPANPITPSPKGVDSAVPALLVQQRHILGMMGLDIWVQRDRATSTVDYDTVVEQHNQRVNNQASQSRQHMGQAVVSEAPVVASHNGQASQPATAAVTEAPVINRPDISRPNIDHPVVETGNLTANPIQALKQKLDVAEGQNTQAKVSLADSLEQVAPFEIVGVSFKDWVLIADAETFKQPQQLALWENILSALSLSPQVLKFPICPGISDKESANASVAGFIFCLAKRNDVKVGALTEMPKSLSHPQLVTLPYLADMLQNSDLKKQLWQTLNQK